MIPLKEKLKCIKSRIGDNNYFNLFYELSDGMYYNVRAKLYDNLCFNNGRERNNIITGITNELEEYINEN